MKLLFLFVLFVPIALFSQQNGQSNYSKQLVEIQTSKLTPTQPQKIKQSFSSSSTSENRNTYPMTISSTDNAQISQPKPVRTLEQINYHLDAIDAKIEYVSSDQSMKAKAEQDGWFDQMNGIKAALLQEKQSLIKQ
jgi:hypothetical protein